ncbi:hypothetical protein JOD43_003528 [Pullulanibacillus pueri]|uniref:DUF2089 domain-containing protein n=1 Tax=Pullulanibacillus pueri TaxID=1437324 RepID=A0A8J2ZZT5_9BACL|nr:DUF2089 domain-containing protein [Pullulanibacillus pueri]MBM7683348.1 hypothetical protein [Pullulanibacillus pueri]GGH86641.1 hypothetical protein GCM10007096_34820 [Pullulanibacillus pueri]
MSYPMLTTCPVCNEALTITKLQCTHCHTTIENEFQLSKLASLSQEQLYFVETFLKCRGNIKEVEKELGISYPTVRAKLNDIVEGLGYTKQKSQESESKVISMLEAGEITPDEAIKMLKKDL